MLRRSLHELAIATFFNNDELAKCFRLFLLEKNQDVADLLNICRKTIEPAFESVHSRQFRANDIANVFSSIWQEELFSCADILLLDNIFKRLMFRNGDYFQYREEHVQAYAKFCIDVDPTLVVGWHIAGAIKGKESLTQNDLLRIIPNQYPLFCPASSHEKMYAEGHVHWGGITPGHIFITEKMTSGETPKDWLQYRILNKLLYVILNKKNEKYDALKDLKLALNEKQTTKNFPKLDWECIKDSYAPTTEINASWLGFVLAKSVIEKKYSEAWIWLVCLLWYIYRSESTGAVSRVMIFYIFMMTTDMRKKAIMDGQGLTQFLKIQDLGKLNEKFTQEHRSRILPGSRDVAEVKMGTDSFSVKKLITIERSSPTLKKLGNRKIADNDSLINRQLEIDHIRQLERIHFCLHFMRKSSSDSPINTMRNELWDKTSVLENIFNTNEMWFESQYVGALLLPEYKYHPGRWIRGLDVAGDENVQRIEEHAPMLRWLRRGLISSYAEVPVPGPHLSIHAGEDYAHPLSGLRHIDETVKFCEMRAGDRLGHALALGMEPAIWSEAHGDMMLSAEEHLDNLVWAWHMAIELSSSLILATQIIPRLEQRIAKIIPYVSWTGLRLNQILMADPLPENIKEIPDLISRAPSPAALHNAWELRRNCHHIFKKNLSLQDKKTHIAVPDFDRLYKAFSNKLGMEVGTPEWLYFEREAYLEKIKNFKQFNVLIRSNVQQQAISLMQEENGSILIHDYDSAEDLEFMTALQDYLMDRYDRLGLLIETNPTSNVYISRMNKHADHPIFRWSPPDGKSLKPGEKYNKYGLRNGPLRVLINTDDPGTMPTTLRTEYALILEAAIDLGYARAITENWLDQIRLCGIEQFRRNHIPVFTGLDGEDLYATS